MTLRELYSYMEQPDRLNKSTIEELRLLVESYPYASSFVVLYLYNLAKEEDIRYPAELERLALDVPDRSYLYQLIEGYTAPELKTEMEYPREEEASGFALIDQFLQEQEGDATPLASMVAEDYMALLSAGEQQDDFVEESPKQLVDESPVEASLLAKEKGEEVSQEVLVEDELFTETLARIYIKQGLYDKALLILKQLSLNYPEKNVYFADQIRFLERLTK